jgi:hypothetical protein
MSYLLLVEEDKSYTQRRLNQKCKSSQDPPLLHCTTGGRGPKSPLEVDEGPFPSFTPTFFLDLLIPILIKLFHKIVIENLSKLILQTIISLIHKIYRDTIKKKSIDQNPQ